MKTIDTLAVTYTSLQTGAKENTSDTAVLAATDQVAYYIAAASSAGSTTITFTAYSVQFDPDTAEDCVSLFGASTDGTYNYSSPSTTTFFLPEGHAATPSTTEANHKYRVRRPFTMSNLFTHVSSNARTTDTTFTTRKNGGAGGQSVTYTSGQTGDKEDSSNSDSLTTGDDFYFAITTGTGSETITPRNGSECSVRQVKIPSKLLLKKYSFPRLAPHSAEVQVLLSDCFSF